MNRDIRQLIGNTLRWGVGIACVLTAVGGALYLYRHGTEPLPDYTTFAYGPEVRAADYTTLGGILGGLPALNARSWIQLGVLVLILTPIARVVLSLVDFVSERDWLYAAITAVVLTIILANSVGGC